MSDAETPAHEGAATVVAAFEIARLVFIDADGRASVPLPPFARDDDALIEMYRAMLLTRAFDAKAVALQRTGRLGTYASSLGQEAVSVGVGMAMHDDDVFLPSFREHGAQLLRGVSMVELLMYWGGFEKGCDYAGPREDFPVCIPVASHLPHTVGVAFAISLRGQQRAALCVCGDGATSKGDFYEALNLAGVWRLPAVFVVANNQWAISVPRSAQTAATTLAQKAIAAGIEGLQVDGNDVVAVRHAVDQALTRARAGGGATLIEALTYRLADHTTADDASRYRDDDAVSGQWAAEPVARLRKHLVERGAWSKTDERSLSAQCADEVEAATSAYLATAAEPATSMFDHLYAELPEDLVAQRDAVAARAGEDG